MRSFPAFVTVLALALGCAGSPMRPVDDGIEITTIDRTELPPLDPARTYEYNLAQIDPESVLEALLAEQIPVARAWLPLDNLCLDPRGPRFTVELSRPDARILELGFGLGMGRLACATTLRRYTISD